MHRYTTAVVGLVLASLASMAGAATKATADFNVVAKASPSTLPAYAKPDSARVGRFDSAALDGPSISLTLPDGQTLLAQRVNLVRSNAATTWVGRVDGAPSSTLTLTNYRGAVTGGFTYRGTAYEFRPSAAGLLLYAVDPARLPPLEPPVLPRTKAGDARQKTVATVGRLAADAAPVVQDLLVVYTARALGQMSSADAATSSILNAVQYANQAYVNSGVGVTLNVVGVRQTDFVETTMLEMTHTTMATSPSLAALREETGADLVLLVAAHDDYCGIAWLLDGNDRRLADHPNAVVAAACIGGSTLAHEIGHLQGLDHDHIASPVSGGVFPYGTGIRRCRPSGDGFYDVMSYGCGDMQATALQQFSNPDLTFNGEPTGVRYSVDPANAAEGARALNEIAPLIADYRNGKGVSSYVPPAAPNGLAADASVPRVVSLTWADNSTDEAGFKVLRAFPDRPFVEAGRVPAGVTAFQDNVVPNYLYRYKVQAYSSGGVSLDSNIVEVRTAPLPPPPPPPPPPLAPADVVAVANGPNTVELTWTDASSNETGFAVGRMLASGYSPTQIAVLPPGTTHYIDYDAPGGYPVIYVVWAFNDDGSSRTSSNMVQVTADPALVPATPAGVSVSLGANHAVTVTWPASANAVSYTVMYATYTKVVTRVKVGKKNKKIVSYEWYGAIPVSLSTNSYTGTVDKGTHKFVVIARGPTGLSSAEASSPPFKVRK